MDKIIETIDGINLEFKLQNEKELWLNATKICKERKLNLSHFWNSPETKKYIEVLENKNKDEIRLLSNSQKYWYKQAIRKVGTYIHPKLRVKFARWVDVEFEVACDEAIDKIMKNGYFISEQAKHNPSKELINEVSEISKTRQALYHKRNELMNVIAKFLYGDEWQEHSMATQMSRLHQYCHIAIDLNTAQGVIESKISTNKDKEVVLHSYLKMNDREPNRADYLVALNYYNDEDLKLYLSYFNTALERVVHHIKARHLTPTTQSVIKMLNEIGRDVVKTSTNLEIGDSIQTKNRKNFNIILNQLTDGSLSHEEFLEECEELTLGKDFII